jgi:hypothetical protein
MMSDRESIAFKHPDGRLLPLDEVLRNVKTRYDNLLLEEEKRQGWIKIAASGSLTDEKSSDVTLDVRTLVAGVTAAVESDNHEFIGQLLSRQITISMELASDSMCDYFIEWAIKVKHVLVCKSLLDCVMEMIKTMFSTRSGPTYVYGESAVARGQRLILDRVGGIRGNKVLTEALIRFMPSYNGESSWMSFSRHLLMNDRIEPLLDVIRHKSRSIEVEQRTHFGMIIGLMIHDARNLPSRRSYDRILFACVGSTLDIDYFCDNSLSKINPSILVSDLRKDKQIKGSFDDSAQTFWLIASIYVSARDMFDMLRAKNKKIKGKMNKVVAQYNDLMSTLSELTCDNLAQMTGQYLFAIEDPWTTESLVQA